MFRLWLATAVTIGAICPLAAAFPAAADDLTPSQRTHCLAIGRTLQATEALSSVEYDRQRYKDDPTAKNKQRWDDDADFLKVTTETADALLARFGDADPPTQAEMDALQQVVSGKLVSDGQACLQ